MANDTDALIKIQHWMRQSTIEWFIAPRTA
jgi:hypothetical protein